MKLTENELRNTIRKAILESTTQNSGLMQELEELESEWYEHAQWASRAGEDQGYVLNLLGDIQDQLDAVKQKLGMPIVELSYSFLDGGPVHHPGEQRV